MKETFAFLQNIWSNELLPALFLALSGQWILEGITRKDMLIRFREVVETLKEEQEWLRERVDQINWAYVVEFSCLCFYAFREGASFPDPATLTEETLILHPQQDRPILHTVPIAFLPLETKLFAEGGTHVVYRGEPHLQELIARGQVFDGRSQLVKGEPGRCHQNAARLWQVDPEIFSIVTGYALSSNGLWRQHSWLLRNRRGEQTLRIVETTVRRVKYFGVVLSPGEAEQFVRLVN